MQQGVNGGKVWLHGENPCEVGKLYLNDAAILDSKGNWHIYDAEAALNSMYEDILIRDKIIFEQSNYHGLLRDALKAISRNDTEESNRLLMEYKQLIDFKQ